MAKWALLAVILVSGCGGDDGDCGDAAVAGDSVATGVVCEGDFAISNSVELEALANCKEVTGNLGIVDNDALTSISLPLLASVGGALYIENNDNDALTELNFPLLASVGGYLGILRNDALTELSLPLLASVGGAPALGGPGGHLAIVDNDALTSISLPALASVGGRLLFRDNAALCQSIADELVARVDVQGEVIAGHLDVTGNRDGC